MMSMGHGHGNGAFQPPKKSVTVSADIPGVGLKIDVNGADGTNIHWHATVITSEVI